MRTFWGAVTEIGDLGVVAEHCPHCERPMCCLLRSVCRGNYVFFVKMAEPSRETSCMCTGCLKTFPGEPYWHYAALVPVREAQRMELDSLLAKTNPVLADRIRFQEQIRDLGGDNRFAVAYGHLEGMRPGALRADLLRKLLDWHRFDELQRAELGQHIAALARAWQFIRQLASGFPASAGCLTYVVAALVAGLLILCVPAVRSWLGGTITVVSCLIAAAVVHHILLTQSVHRWTRHVLIPHAEDADVSLECVVAVVDDVPGSRLWLTEDLWPMKEQLQTICGILVAEQKVQRS
ncbi:MAG TPA: hypothetical protein VFI31_00375 [Pirellulales bacterium]|nr:hypothetical protein [Pirellulales bacterium]